MYDQPTELHNLPWTKVPAEGNALDAIYVGVAKGF